MIELACHESLVRVGETADERAGFGSEVYNVETHTQITLTHTHHHHFCNEEQRVLQGSAKGWS